ncbi:MAG: ABC transporter permease [Opitutae bacterium]|nr:ABC transporter permease [Opitutae bacterium]
MLAALRFSLRLLAKSPGFTAAAVGVLALGIGLNTGMFTVIYGLAFSPRPFAEPDRIVRVYTQDKKQPDDYRLFSYPLWRELNERRDLFRGVLGFNQTIVGHQAGTETRRTFAAIITSNYFETLGVRLARGRAFTAAEERPGAAVPVVIVSHAHWRKTGFDPGLLGRPVRINEKLFTVVGIAPEGFSGTTAFIGPEFFFPLGTFELLENFLIGEERRSLDRADAYQLFLVARLAPGIEDGSAKAALATLGANLERAYPAEFKDQTVALGPLPRMGTSSAPRSEAALTVFCVVLMALAGAVLLIVCLNLASLLLARGQARRKEFAIRLALGGSRAQLVRQLCLEGFILSLLGGGLGLLAADATLGVITASLEARLPVTLCLTSSGSMVVVAATAVICTGATLAFSLGPALKLSRADVLTDLKQQAGEDVTGPRRAWWLPRHPLVVTQIALSLALLIVAGLFLRMTFSALATDHGFRADNTVVAEVDANLGGLAEARGLGLFRAAQERLAALPGVQAAALGAIVPYGFISIGRDVRRDGPKPAADAKPATAAEGRAYDGRWNSVGADYFTVMGLRVREGRAFTVAEATAPGGPRVAILDETLARKLWPDGGAVGQFIRFTGREDARVGAMQVVGVAASSSVDFFEESPSGAVYVPFAQGYSGNAHFHVRPVSDTPAAALALVPRVRAILHETAAGVPVFKVSTFRQHAETSMEVWAAGLGSVLLAVFSGFAMLVAVVGIYSVKAYQVSRRTREIGIRMALGAVPGAIQSLILREGLATASLGIGAGLLLGLGLNRFIGSVMHGVKPFDPLVLAAAAAAFLLSAALASWIPARRATRVNPLVALRSE